MSRKEPNPSPESLGLVKPAIRKVSEDMRIPKKGVPDKPGYPGDRPPAPKMPLTLNKARLTALFNEWNRRYSENPDSFSNSLDKEGKPVTDYGECCAIYFSKLYNEFIELS